MSILVPSRDELRAERARRSLGAFVREAWPVLEPGTEFVSNWHIDAICEHLEAITAGELQRLIVNIPPRHMKSLAVTVFWPCWEWLSRPETDNLKAAVKQVLRGRRRVEADRFVALRSHYLFDSQFTRPGREGAHEKGGVESEVGRLRWTSSNTPCFRASICFCPEASL